MRTFLILLVPVLSGTMSAALAGSWTGNVNAFLGMKYLDEDDWSPMEEQPEGGILFDIGKIDWPVHILVESMYSMDDDVISGVDVEATTTELILGVKKIWAPNSSIRPYIGGGLCFASAELKGSQGYQQVSDDDSGTGFSICGGVYWTIGRHFNLGLDLRYSTVEATLYETDAAIGGTHSGLLLGYHW